MLRSECVLRVQGGFRTTGICDLSVKSTDATMVEDSFSIYDTQAACS